MIKYILLLFIFSNNVNAMFWSNKSEQINKSVQKSVESQISLECEYKVRKYELELKEKPRNSYYKWRYKVWKNRCIKEYE